MSKISERPKRWRIIDRFLESSVEFSVVLLLWICFGAFVLLWVGFQTNSWIIWLIACIAAPLLWAFGEGFVELIRKFKPVRTLRRYIDQATKTKSLSALRIMYLLFEFLFLMGLMYALYFFGKYIFSAH